MLNFADAPLRRVRLLRGYGAFVVGAVLFSSYLWTPLPDSARMTEAVSIAAICVFGVSQLWLANRTPTDARIRSRFAAVENLPAASQIPVLRRQLALGAVLFPACSAWVAYDLHRLDGGQVDRVLVWMPVGIIYEHLGYGPAVLTTPALGAIVVALLLSKLKRLSVGF